jgi:hypothetical protein
VAGRDRTYDAPRFRRALYLLSYGHLTGEGSGTRTRTSASTFRAWHPAIRRSRIGRVDCCCAAPPTLCRRVGAATMLLEELCHAGYRRTMLSEPLACSSTLDRLPSRVQARSRRPSWRSFGARVLVISREIDKLKQTLHFLRHSTRPTKRLSLSSGASIRSRSFSS